MGVLGSLKKRKLVGLFLIQWIYFWIKKVGSFVLFWTWYEGKNAFQSLNVQEDFKWTCKLIRTWVTIYILSIYIKL
jgi:hypothetical protein